VKRRTSFRHRSRAPVGADVGRRKTLTFSSVDDRTLIDAFVEYLRDWKYPGLKVDRRPDQENRDVPDIDAIAGPFAIEHTSIDSVPHQRRNNDWFMEAVGGLEDEFPNLPFRLNITLKYEAVTTGQNWAVIRQYIKQWIASESQHLADRVHLITIPGVPFEITVRKSGSRAPGLFFSRVAPNDSTLASRIRHQVDRKAQKLTPYKASGLTTLLLLENEDVALMNESIMLEAVRDAYPGGFPPLIDQVWYADTSLSSDIAFYDFTSALREAPR